MATNDVKDMSEDIGAETTSSEDPSGSEDDMSSWVTWFCRMKGNEFFCEVDEDYIQDDFNLSGLSSQVPYYEYALEVILDAESFQDELLTEAQQAAVEAAAEALYGLIHARFILTSRGLTAMADKFRSCDFGRCPRVLCNGQPCLPVGFSDIPRQSTVKLFCPRCEDAYYPRSKYHGSIDGAYFGTTFPHLFCLTYPSLKPQKPPEKYVPRVFGFKISPLAFKQNTNTPLNGAGTSSRGTKQQGAGPNTSSSQQPQQQVNRTASPANNKINENDKNMTKTQNKSDDVDISTMNDTTDTTDIKNDGNQVERKKSKK